MNKERPILFSGPMVRAILEGRKTQTRRVVKLPNDASKYAEFHHIDLLGNAVFTDRSVVGGYGKPGDRLWVRETWECWNGFDVNYKADSRSEQLQISPWKPSIHMPRWASRITLEVVSVRVERLQDITNDDAIDEGTEGVDYFHDLWERINGPGSWDANPFVWVVTFRRINHA